MRAYLPYLIIEIERTTMSGAHAVIGPNGLIYGIDCRIPIMRK
jgi:hypothetical protein